MIDPLHADTVRLMFRLSLHGDSTSGAMGVKAIASYLNANRIFTRDGGLWGLGAAHQILTRSTYTGRHEFDRRGKGRQLNTVSEIVAVDVPPIIDHATFDTVQARMKAQSPKVTPPQVVGRPTLLTGLIHCAKCGGAMAIRIGESDRMTLRFVKPKK